MATTYKPFSADDAASVIEMMVGFYAIDNYPISIPDTEKLFAEFVSNENLGKGWLILSDEKIVGYMILTFVFSFEFRGKIAFIDELYIKDNARGKGIGKDTVAFIQSESKKLSVKMLYLEVEHHNSNAQKLYANAGFKIHSRKFMQYKINL